jgi:hypothetical protein
MTVHGMTQELAANVVHYRGKKGPFHAIEDLIKVSKICSELPNFQLFSIICWKVNGYESVDHPLLIERWFIIPCLFTFIKEDCAYFSTHNTEIEYYAWQW